MKDKPRSKRVRVDLNRKWKFDKRLHEIKKDLVELSPNELYSKLKPLKVEGSGAIEITENKHEKIYEYKGEKSITSQKEAEEFFKIDLDKYEIERTVFNSWDVSMKRPDGSSFKRTNYQVKLFTRKIEKLIIQEPKPTKIKYKPKGGVELWVVIGCVHRPFHNKKLWDRFISFLDFFSDKITGIIINGDYLDLRSMSQHDEYIPDGIDLGYEYSDGLQGICDIDECIPDAKKYYLYGNHEDRFFRAKKELRRYGDALESPTDGLKLDHYGYEVIEDYRDGYITLGDNLEIFHGEYAGKTAARRHLEAMPDKDCYFNHTHRMQSYHFNKRSAYNGGWMGDVNDSVFKYRMRRSKYAWTNGFGVVYLSPTGSHNVQLINCSEGRIMFEGKIF